MATRTTFVGRSTWSRSVQPGPVPGLARRQRGTVRAACTSKRPIVPSPRLDIRHSLSLPPLDCCRGTRPRQAESCQPERNCAPSPIVTGLDRPATSQRRQNRRPDRRQQTLRRPRRLAHEMQQRLVLRGHPARHKTRHYRLHALAIPRQQTTRTVIPERLMAVLSVQHTRQIPKSSANSL